MMKRLVSAVLSATALCACEMPAPAPDAPTTRVGVAPAASAIAQKAPPSEADLDKLSCTQETEIGSRFAHRVCMTERQRRQLAQDARDSIGARGCTGGSCGN